MEPNFDCTEAGLYLIKNGERTRISDPLRVVRYSSLDNEVYVEWSNEETQTSECGTDCYHMAAIPESTLQQEAELSSHLNNAGFLVDDDEVNLIATYLQSHTRRIKQRA